MYLSKISNLRKVWIYFKFTKWAKARIYKRLSHGPVDLMPITLSKVRGFPICCVYKKICRLYNDFLVQKTFERLLYQQNQS